MSTGQEISKSTDGPDAEPAKIERIERNAARQLMVHLAGRGEPVVDATAARCFPWSLPESYISIRDAEGKELALLETLDELVAASAAT